MTRTKKTPCEKCPLYQQKCKGFLVPPQGELSARLALVTEVPGLDEAKADPQRPVVGKSEKIIRGMLEELGYADDVYITSAVKCWPGPGAKPNSKPVSLCREAYLDEELSQFEGKRIITLGRTATHSLWRKARRLNELIGHPEIIEGHEESWTKEVLAVWHPMSYLQTGNRQILVDIKRALIWGLVNDKRKKIKLLKETL